MTVSFYFLFWLNGKPLSRLFCTICSEYFTVHLIQYLFYIVNIVLLCELFSNS